MRGTLRVALFLGAEDLNTTLGFGNLGKHPTFYLFICKD